VSPEGRPVRCGGWAMNELLDFHHTALAALISRRWQEDRPYFTLIEELAEPGWQARGGGNRRTVLLSCTGLVGPLHSKCRPSSRGCRYKRPSRGDPL